ncbi:hypothetical protein IFR04_006384 [Cadophora malorum]|uniref:Uncharacterized protein n=1 Tax=Cadophora malorum TaxID=108018 RepID=A0A8H7WBD1_9HELO|nr:hypothetical protein IFR04_006384 [Cadophora malorum]
MASKIPSMIGSPYRGPNVPNAGVLIVQAAVRICPKRHSSLSTINLESLVMICVTSTDLKSEECRSSAVVQKVGDSRIYPVTLLPYKNYSKSKHMQLGRNFPAGSGICLGSCGAGKIPVISSTYPMMIEPGKDVATVNACLVSGKALYCCSERAAGASPCTYYPDTCIGIDKNGQPTKGTGCPNPGQKLVTYARGKCSPRKGEWSPFCCESDVVTDECRWTKGNVVLMCEGAGNVMAQAKFRSSKTSIMVPDTNADTPAQVAAQ